MNFTPNSILANKYKLTRPLGEGGMGCVWVADHLHLDRQVAIKVISTRVLSEPTVRDRFETEARATAKVESPHVVQVLDFDYTEEGLPFLVLELLVGETLEQRLSREGVLSLNDARDLMKQTTHALTEAHQAGILHRDIKADNLFLVAKDELFVKLLDFGIAIRSDRASNPDAAVDTAELSPIGTPLYMSPEQALATGGIDERSDLYSLAVCMYYALTGEFPYCADTLAVLAFAQQREEFTLPSAIRKELGPAVDAFFLRALAFHSEDRFSSAERMCEAFTRACDRRSEVDAGTKTVRPAALGPLVPQLDGAPRTRSTRRRRWPTFAVAAAAATAGFLLIPRSAITHTPYLSTAAAFVANRLPTSPVAAATEDGPQLRLDRKQGTVPSSLLAMPIVRSASPTTVVAPIPIAATHVSKSTKKASAKEPEATEADQEPLAAAAPPVDAEAAATTSPTAPIAEVTAAAPAVTETTNAAAEPQPEMWIERK